jgi:hypothetical protein
MPDTDNKYTPSPIETPSAARTFTVGKVSGNLTSVELVRNQHDGNTRAASVDFLIPDDVVHSTINKEHATQGKGIQNLGPGGVAYITPHNPENMVKELCNNYIDVLNWADEANKSFVVTRYYHERDGKEGYSADIITTSQLEEFFQRQVDLCGAPPLTLYNWLYHRYGYNPMTTEDIKEVVEKQNMLPFQKALERAQKEGKTTFDIIKDCCIKKNCKIDLHELLLNARPMYVRQYTLSKAPYQDSEGKWHAAILVAEIPGFGQATKPVFELCDGVAGRTLEMHIDPTYQPINFPETPEQNNGGNIFATFTAGVGLAPALARVRKDVQSINEGNKPPLEHILTYGGRGKEGAIYLEELKEALEIGAIKELRYVDSKNKTISKYTYNNVASEITCETIHIPEITKPYVQCVFEVDTSFKNVVNSGNIGFYGVCGTTGTEKGIQDALEEHRNSLKEPKPKEPLFGSTCSTPDRLIAYSQGEYRNISYTEDDSGVFYSLNTWRLREIAEAAQAAKMNGNESILLLEAANGNGTRNLGVVVHPYVRDKFVQVAKLKAAAMAESATVAATAEKAFPDWGNEVLEAPHNKAPEVTTVASRPGLPHAHGSETMPEVSAAVQAAASSSKYTKAKEWLRNPIKYHKKVKPIETFFARITTPGNRNR